MKPQEVKEANSWLALMIGNSRLHWALFSGTSLQNAWEDEHLGELKKNKQRTRRTGEKSPKNFSFFPFSHSKFPIPHSEVPIPLVLASVVPLETALWQTYPTLREITLEQVPLTGLYPTMGIDRALAVFGAGEVWGFPVLVIDAGTALTFTGADTNGQLVGGAILPGLKLQLQSLAQGTSALPEIRLPSTLPSRWALNTASAIQSGIVYTVLAGLCNFIDAWWREFPNSPVILTGGDRTRILTYLQNLYPNVANKLISDPHLIFWGMRSLVIDHQQKIPISNDE